MRFPSCLETGWRPVLFSSRHCWSVVRALYPPTTLDGYGSSQEKEDYPDIIISYLSKGKTEFEQTFKTKDNVSNLFRPKYSNPTKVFNDFKNSYLNSLEIILDDEKFKEKADNLPLLKSSVINRYEKILTKKNEKKNLNNQKNKANTNIHNNKKIIQTRYIILDKQLTELSLKAIEENDEINNKLTDPFNSFFQDNNPNIRRNAMEQITNNIFEESNENNDKDKLPEIVNYRQLNLDNENNKDIFLKDIEVLEHKYKLNTEIEKKAHEKYGNAINQFEKKCQNYNIITLGQKIDFFSYLYNLDSKRNQKNYKTNKSSINNSPRKKDNNKNSYYNNLPSFFKKALPSLKRKNTFLNIDLKDLEGRLLYYTETKSNFKILSEDNIINNSKANEKYERELNNKIKNFQLVKNKLESSNKLIDKIKLYLLITEISNDKIFLRECNITSDNFLFLLYKKYFDFSKIKQINLSKNNLGDTGGSYLLFLISKFSKNLEYLNISYNKIGKNACNYLNQILIQNDIKITSLSIGGNNLGDELFSEILVAISYNTYLKKLFINDNNLGRISSSIIGNFLKYDKKIKLLDVSKNDFNDEVINFLLKGLIINSTLDILFLNDLNLTNKSFRTFDTTLSNNNNLKKIFLEKNKFNFKAAQKLSDILNKNKYLEYISLVGNNFNYEHLNYVNEQQRQIKIKVISKSDYFNQIGIENNSNIYDYLQ